MLKTIEQILCECNMFYESEDAIKQTRLSLIKDSFKYHFEGNRAYREICKKNNVTPDSICTYSDLIKIPLIPVSIFKNKEKRDLILTVPKEDCLMRVESSGTSGRVSVSYKDKVTAIRNTISLATLYGEFLTDVFGGFGMLFTIPNKYLPRLGLMKMMNMFQLYLDDFEFVTNDPSIPPDFEKVMDILFAKKGKEIRHLIGVPFLIYDFAIYMQKNHPGRRISLDSKSLIITLGGWKRRKGEDVCVREEFNHLMQDVFDVSNEQIRDLFAQAESNIFIMECEYQRKHVPPWAYFSIRDFENPLNVEKSQGEEGMLAFFDPLNNTFPGFIVSGEVGSIPGEGICKCG
ncbi:hypothetical protein JXL19_05720, partial [bacterium]|nr:hypothetical protein [bacterium]